MCGFLPREGAFLRMPDVPGQPARVWLVRGGSALRRAEHPVPGGLSVYSPPFFLDDPKPWLVPDPAQADGAALYTADELLAKLDREAVSSDRTGALHWETPPFAPFQESFDDLQARFCAGQLKKAVPVFFEQARGEVAAPDMAQMVAAALRAPETLMPYGCWTADVGMIGASPELLFTLREGVLQTMALAGTLPVPDAQHAVEAERAFLSDTKERREHRLVIEGIAEALSPFGSVDIGETSVLKLPQLWHLRTPITVLLRDNPSVETLARALHPTPALGGTPRQASFEWLREQCPSRGKFGAPFGVQMPDGSAVCVVSVRNVLWQDGLLRIGAGCGIIHESQVSKEWEELRQKRESVKRLMGW